MRVLGQKFIEPEKATSLFRSTLLIRRREEQHFSRDCKRFRYGSMDCHTHQTLYSCKARFHIYRWTYALMRNLHLEIWTLQSIITHGRFPQQSAMYMPLFHLPPFFCGPIFRACIPHLLHDMKIVYCLDSSCDSQRTDVWAYDQAFLRALLHSFVSTSFHVPTYQQV